MNIFIYALLTTASRVLGNGNTVLNYSVCVLRQLSALVGDVSV